MKPEFKSSMIEGENHNSILVIGLGNTILTDDGIGIYVCRELKTKVLAEKRNTANKETQTIDFIEASLGGLELLETMKGYNKIILIDAVHTGKESVGSLIPLNVSVLPTPV